VLIPRCDVFVTAVSSVMRWAIAGRKPVVNYDVYNFDYPEYVDAPGVANVATKDDFRSALRRLATDAAAWSAEVAEQTARGGAWGTPDGLSGTRFLQLVDSMVAAQSINLSNLALSISRHTSTQDRSRPVRRHRPSGGAA